MNRNRIVIVVAIIVAAIVLGVLLWLLLPRSESNDPASATPTPSSTATVSATPTPTPSPSPTSVVATCENISTEAWQAETSSIGWVSWETQNETIGARPFESFPDGTPDGAIVCRWGADPYLATDNIADLAWSPIDPESAVSAMKQLEAAGFTHIDTPEGVYLAMRAEPGSQGDAEGYGSTYLFTDDDVRWAAYKDEIRFITSPTGTP